MNFIIFFQLYIWEDGFNCIRCAGDISNITVHGGVGDGIDLDVTELKVKNVHIDGLGNDCVDFSGGKNFLRKFLLEGCGDKGISLGEKGVLEIRNGSILKSKIGIAVKDSSTINIHQSSMEPLQFIDVEVKWFKGNKKQEYGNGHINFH